MKTQKMLDALESARLLPPLLARATLAAAFVASGRKKLSDIKGNAEFFGQLGIPMPELMVPFVSGTEITCGALLGAGLLTRFAALPLIPVMVVAILTARRKEVHSFGDLTGVFEFSYIILLSYLAIYGGGEVSMDRLFRRVRELPTPARASSTTSRPESPLHWTA